MPSSTTCGTARRCPRLPAEVTRPWWLAPPGTLRTVLAGDVLTLHTVQSAAAYDTLCSTGQLTGDPAYAEPAFASAYRWMREEMDEWVGPADGIVWLWANPTRRFLARECRTQRGDVLLTVRMARTGVVLSQFQSWHLVLNACGEPAEWRRTFDLSDREEPFQVQATANRIWREDVVRACRIAS